MYILIHGANAIAAKKTVNSRMQVTAHKRRDGLMVLAVYPVATVVHGPIFKKMFHRSLPFAKL